MTEKELHMSTENDTTAADQVDAVLDTPENFSMYDFLDEVEYPEDEVTVATNEKAAHQLGRLASEIQQYMADGEPETGEHDPEKLAEYRKELDSLTAKIENSKITFYLKGVSDERVLEADALVEEKFKDKKKSQRTADNRLVQVLPQEHQKAWMRYLNAVIFSMHIERIHYHGPGVTKIGPTPDDVAAFYDRAPAAAQAILTSRIQKLRVAAEDYERKFDEGFFPNS